MTKDARPNRPASDLSTAAWQLAAAQSTGTLCTLSSHQPGFPFGSLCPYALDDQRRPVLLLSGLALHTQNLQAQSAASLFIQAAAPGDGQASPRLTLLGQVTPVPADQFDTARACYLAKHPQAAQWSQFGDFTFYHMTLTAAYYVAGFGQMGWLPINTSATTEHGG